MPDSLNTLDPAEEGLRRRHLWRYRVALVLAVVIPILAAALFSWIDVRQNERNDAALAARVVRNQVATILGRAQGLGAEIVPYASQPCTQIADLLRRKQVVEPYFRSLLLVERERIYCTSVAGYSDVRLANFPAFVVHAPSGRWARIVPGTPLRADHPALLVGQPGGGGRDVVVVVDGQYLLDLLAAITPLTDYQIELRVGDGVALESGALRASSGSVQTLFREESGSQYERIDVAINGDENRLLRAWRQRMLQLMPFAVLLAGVLAWLCYRSQRGGQSMRELVQRGIRGEEFHVEYQPVYGVASRRCEGVEALLRWTRPDGHPVAPEIFIPRAQAAGVIVELTRHLMTLVTRDCHKWSVAPGFHVAINVEPEHLSGTCLLADMHAFVEQLAGEQLKVVLEVTERNLIDDAEQARANLSALRAQGVRVAIDDFGTGYCSLSYLQSLPFDLLKIDRAFVQTIGPGPDDAPVLDTVISLAHRLGAQLVAEGVETMAQFDYLRDRDVAYVQGYLYARPMRADAFARWYATTEQHALPTQGASTAKA